MRPKGLYNLRVDIYFIACVHLLWKPELLPVKKAAAPRILSNNRKLANQTFTSCRLVPVGDREMPGWNILWPRLCIQHKGKAEISNTLQPRKMVKIRLCPAKSLILEEILAAKTSSTRLNYVPRARKQLVSVALVMGKKPQTVQFKILLRGNLTKKPRLGQSINCSMLEVTFLTFSFNTETRAEWQICVHLGNRIKIF